MKIKHSFNGSGYTRMFQNVVNAAIGTNYTMSNHLLTLTSKEKFYKSFIFCLEENKSKYINNYKIALNKQNKKNHQLFSMIT